MTEQTDESAAFIDLDAALAERTEEPVRVKHNGTTYDLPPVLSAEAMLAALRLDTDADRGTLTEINMRLVLTDEVFDSLVADQRVDVFEQVRIDRSLPLCLARLLPIGGQHGAGCGSHRCRREETTARDRRIGVAACHGLALWGSCRAMLIGERTAVRSLPIVGYLGRKLNL